MPDARTRHYFPVSMRERSLPDFHVTGGQIVGARAMEWLVADELGGMVGVAGDPGFVAFLRRASRVQAAVLRLEQLRESVCSGRVSEDSARLEIDSKLMAIIDLLTHEVPT